MRVVTSSALRTVLGRLDRVPRVVVSGNFATPWQVLRELDVGALRSPGGRAIIALPSWHPNADVSTVVPRLAAPVTSFQHSFIVSEQGTATIWGNDASAQAADIIGHVAHPAARAELRDSARGLGFRF